MTTLENKNTDPNVPGEKPVQQEKKNEEPAPDNHRRSHILWWVTALLVIIAVVWILLWFFYFQYHETTDDAYANGNMVVINSAISGSVVAFFTDETDRVVEGQLLVMLDSTQYLVEYDRALAELAAAVLQVRQLYDNVEVNLAALENKLAALEKAKYDYDNRLNLVEFLAVSNEEFVHSKDNLFIAEMDFKQAEAQLQVSLDAAGNTSIEKHPTIEQHKAEVRRAYYNLQHCAIYAPSTGYVAQRTVQVGQWVTPTSSLMAVIPTDYVWVDANFKETQLTYMRIGQPATVWFDMYGSDVKFEGEVIGISSGSGSVFSLIPPQNATGNWIKIVQRLAVRISLDRATVQRYPIRLGVSANVNVTTTQRDLPMLTSAARTTAVATTDVFDIHLAEVDKIIDKVISENLLLVNP